MRKALMRRSEVNRAGMEDALWWKEGVIYQIYPRSYFDSTGDGIGDLPGITQKLDYLSDLGVDAIWLSPIYPSPDVDFGYDVSNYLDIDPKFGTMADFERLLEEAHRRGLRVILDLVLNHTSDQHPWFQGARQGKESETRDYYLWAGARPGGKPPNNWGSLLGGRAWSYDEASGEYYLHLFYKEQPDVNWRNPRVHDAMLDVVRFWCDKGVDGFRLDVFNLYYKHAGLPDNPRRLIPSPPYVRRFDWQKHLYDYDQPEMMPLLREIRQILDSYPERYAVGETFPDDAEAAARYSAPGTLHAAFNFEFTHCPWSARRFRRAISRWEGLLGPGQWPTYVLGNHDLTRLASRYGVKGNDDRLKVAAAMLLSLRGTPFIYYGNEIGMRDIPIKRKEDVLDPVGRRFWPFFKGRDGCRSPMQWTAARNAGFSTGKPWLPVHHNFVDRNVESQLEDPASILNFYRSLLRLRKKHAALRRGDLAILTGTPGAVLAFRRECEEETLFISLNFSRRTHRLAHQDLHPAGLDLLFSSHPGKQVPSVGGQLVLAGNQVLILTRK
jgi:alpha-glucosidase